MTLLIALILMAEFDYFNFAYDMPGSLVKLAAVVILWICHICAYASVTK